MDDANVAIALVALQVDLLLICTNHLVRIALEHVVDDTQEHCDVAQQLGGDALACGVDGHFTPRAREHECCSKHADADGLAEPVGTRMERVFSSLSLGHSAGSEDDGEDYRACDERTKRQAATEYALNLCKQLDVLEDVLALPLRNNNVLNGLRRDQIMECYKLFDRDTFSMADAVEYAEGLQAYVLKKYPSTSMEPSRTFNREAFHKDLARLWGQLDHHTQEKLSKGMPIATVIDQLSQELININKSWNKMPAKFVFPDA